MAEVVDLYAGFASSIQVHFAALNDLDSVPSTAGWYSWFQIPSSLSPESLQLYRHSKVVSAVTGIFNLTFEGCLRAADGNSLPPVGKANEEETLEQLRSLFLAFAPPLYIGISKNLRTRLKSHRKNLQNFLTAFDYKGIDAEEKGAGDPDTERESQYFGARVGLALRTLNLSADTLYVKCVLADDTSNLKEIERVLNFALTPHYGRK
jgi:hypothetical protein